MIRAIAICSERSSTASQKCTLHYVDANEIAALNHYFEAAKTKSNYIVIKHNETVIISKT